MIIVIDQFLAKRVINRKHCQASRRDFAREAVALISGHAHTFGNSALFTKVLFSSTSVVPLSNRASSGVRASERER